jgi:hypothetical protein
MVIRVEELTLITHPVAVGGVVMVEDQAAILKLEAAGALAVLEVGVVAAALAARLQIAHRINLLVV